MSYGYDCDNDMMRQSVQSTTYREESQVCGVLVSLICIDALVMILGDPGGKRGLGWVKLSKIKSLT